MSPDITESMRAATYEHVYFKPERQADLRAMETQIECYFKGRRVLESACGTGWWTAHGARDCTSWLATDLNPETVANQTRTLDDGSVHEVLKNFPTRDEALSMLGPRAQDPQWLAYGHYWVLSYALR